MVNLRGTNIVYDTVFCDWLDITFPESSISCDEIVEFFSSVGLQLDTRKTARGGLIMGCVDSSIISDIIVGVMTIDEVKRYGLIRVSLSGEIMSYLRQTENLNEVLSFFSQFPYHITRMDCAMDIQAASWEKIRKLKAKFPVECSLSSRSLRTHWILKTGDNGHETGTFYVGDTRKSTVATARCYDKRQQVKDKYGMHIPEEVFRYEIVCKFKRDRKGATLRDVGDPSSLFYHYASPSLRRKPKSVPDWVPNFDLGFTVDTPVEVLPAVKIKNLLSGNPVINYLATLTQIENSGGVEYAQQVFRKELESAIQSFAD